MSTRTLIAIGLAALIPVWVYALGITGGVLIGVASTISVLLTLTALYMMFGPHETPDASGV